MRRSHLLFAALLFLVSTIAFGQCGQNYDRDVRRIVKASEKLPHEKTRIVFAGSSTFRLWDNMAESFPEYEVVNAGIGGSCFDDLYRYKEQLISGTEPNILVIYEGDNDIVHVEEDGNQRGAFEILSNAWKLMNWIQNTHPNLPVFILSPKPSPSRWEHVAKYKAVNSQLQGLAEAYNYHFMDCWPWLTDNNGQVNPELFIFDELHLNAQGNQILGRFMSEAIRNAYFDEQTLDAFVDQWHLAAATADSAGYFGAFYNEQSIFQGTDGGEYWTAGDFLTWAAPYFRRESAWTFEAFERHWYRKGNTLWFNER
ncbi:MAG: GDSL-type esterase/lipase family protein, partial [Schleiferiaceae bacterium]